MAKRESFGSTMRKDLLDDLRKYSDESDIPISKLLDKAVILLLESRGIQRDQQRTLGAPYGIPRDEYNQAHVHEPAKEYDQFEVDLNSPSPKKRNTTTFIKEGRDIELNDPKGDK
jgi:hypothetical protein